MKSVLLLLGISLISNAFVVFAHDDGLPHQHDHEKPHHIHGRGPHRCIHDELKKVPGYQPPQKIDVSYPKDAVFPKRLKKDSNDQTVAEEKHLAQKVMPEQALPIQGTYNYIRVTTAFDVDGKGACNNVGDRVTDWSGATVTCTSDDVLTQAKRDYIMNVLMAKSVEWMQKALKVVRVSGNLIVGGTSRCGSTPGITIPSADQATGIANSDFHIYVTANPMADPNGATVAWATACRTDSNERPVVGHVNWVPRKLTNAVTLNAITQEEDINTGIHEISHALGFSGPFFDGTGYLNEAGTAMVTGGTTTTMDNTLGKNVTKIVSPRALREARKYFGCSTMDGIEIEDQGGSGTRGSHWEKRILWQEYMNGFGAEVKSYKSAITLGFFEDTGFYQADYSAVDTQMRHGNNKGCAFVSEKCNSATNKASGDFCFESDNNVKYCTTDYLARGYCGAATYTSSLPSNFQYFSDSRIGGAVSVSDYCPAALPYSNQICIDSTATDSQNIYGNIYGASSRCFISNLLSKSYVLSDTSGTRCFQATCVASGTGTRISLTISGQTVLCPADGSQGDADISSISASFNGFITCPPASALCATYQSTATGAPPTPAPPTTTTASSPATTVAPGASTTTTTSSVPNSPSSTPAATVDPCADIIARADARNPPVYRAWMPTCGLQASETRIFFGSCTSQRYEYLQRHWGSECSNQFTFSNDCTDGLSGMTKLCDLVNSASLRFMALSAIVATVALTLLMFF